MNPKLFKSKSLFKGGTRRALELQRAPGPVDTAECLPNARFPRLVRIAESQTRPGTTFTHIELQDNTFRHTPERGYSSS